MHKEKTPKVSVCVVTYNQEKYIRQCLQSIVDQETDFDFEVIVADDCSTDGTRAIVQEFAERYKGVVKPVMRSKNIGGTLNFIETHNLAVGIYVAHVDGDDVTLPGKLQKQADFLDRYSDFSVVWHLMNLFDDAGGFFPGGEYDLSFFPNGVVTLEHALRLGTVSAHSSIMYCRTARKTYQANFETLDLFFAWEYLSSGKGKILDDVLGAYRVSAQGSIRGVINCKKLYAHHARYYLKLLPQQRTNIFIFALINFLIDTKNLRNTALDFAKLVLESASLVSPVLFMKTIHEVRRLITYPLRYDHKN